MENATSYVNNATANTNTTGHIFAGGGGDIQGAIAANHQPLWAVEYDKYAAAVLRFRFPEVDVIESDITQLSDDFILSLPRVRILIGGSPCPDFSAAGSGAGLAGDRGQLFFEYLRFLRLLQPEFFIFENVKGMLSSNSGHDFKQILQEFAQVGYVGNWQLRNASKYLPQNRERVFCVGVLRKHSE